jgi:predicted RNase H-like nuclease (RuvC/YqgF family)
MKGLVWMIAPVSASICNYFIMTQHKSLDLLLSLRNTAIEVQREIEVIMPDAIAEALKLAETAKNKVIYHNQDGRIVLVLKKRFSTNKEDTKLARLDEDIQRITGELANKHSEQIAELESQIVELREQIENLEKQRDKLLSDRRIITLKKQYHEHRESTMSLDPNLSVFLN